MGDINDLSKNLCLIDVFRFTIKQKEVNQIEQSVETYMGVNQADSKRCKKLTISCLDLSTKLAENKVLEDLEQHPWDKLQQILFERLMIEDYGSCRQVSLIVPSNNDVLSFNNFEYNSLSNEFNPSDGQLLRYLYGCYYRLQELKRVVAIRSSGSSTYNYQDLSSSLQLAENLILDQVVLYLTEPELFPDRDKRSKNNQQVPILLNLISYYFSKCEDSHVEAMQKFVNSIGESCKSIGDSAYDAIITPTYARLTQKFVSLSIDDATLQEWFTTVKIFVQHPEMAMKFLEKNSLKNDNSISYQSTLLGFMICVSPLPRTSSLESKFFNNIRFGNTDHKFTETQLGEKLKMVGQELHKIFHLLLKSPQTRNPFLSWMGRCLHTFKDRKKLWSNQILLATSILSVNDGFLMNFFTVMLHLCEPFAGPYSLVDLVYEEHETITIDTRMLRVDPIYCKYSKATHTNSPAHFLGLSEETFLISKDRPQSPGDEEKKDYQPNFISECFYGTHQAFAYAFKSIYERFFKLAQNINELQHTLQSAMAAQLPIPPNGPDPLEALREKLNGLMTQFFNIKAVLMVPNRVAMQIHLCIATAAYLNHLVACKDYEEASSSKEFKVITLQTLREKQVSRACLEYIPEMLIENILDFFLFLKNFNDQGLAKASSRLEPLMTLIITFMGNSSLMHNPHLRARFAEILECLMPHQTSHGQQFHGCPELFETHPLIEELVPSLVNVFVSIEMTGEGVQFEQKFSYRRPMYVVLEFLWERELHKRRLIKLGEEAERDIECARPPIFLRFINLLMNDAIFLLDEALGFMNQLREGEHRRQTPEWQGLTPQQRSQAEASYTHVGRMARFHNVLSLYTIGTLAWITSEIKTIFCHPSLVDRIANMLNYFLEHLVGPKKGQFNVTDKNDYEFKPREVLAKICQIYINLGQKDGNKKYEEFCTAVSSDGRSYSDTLLPKATDILFKTGLVSLATEFESLSKLVHEIAVRNQLDEIQTEDIPDNFLDPIMSTLMVDPVLLPSSKIIVDRSTIARHLLSDQTDPFNRSPLSMEEVIPDTDLKNQIEQFLRDQRQQKIAERASDSNK